MTDSLAVPASSPRPLHWPAIVHALKHILEEETQGVYLVGGVVRDAFWGLPAHDIDLVVARDAFRIARHIANTLDGAFYRLDPERQTGRAIVQVEGQRTIIDVAMFRGGSLLEDLVGRDFTLNAVAAPLPQAEDNIVIDPLQGLRDAQDRILRRCSPISIASDPVRALRAIRLSVRFRLRIEPETLADIRQEGPGLARVSPERVRDEFMTLLGGPRPATALRTLDALGLLAPVVPEIGALRHPSRSTPALPDAWAYILRVIDRLEAILQTIGPDRTDSTAAQIGLGMIVYYLDRFRPALQQHLSQPWPNDRTHPGLLTLAALLHPLPSTNETDLSALTEAATLRGEALRLSRHEIERLQAIVRHARYPDRLANQPELTRRHIYRFWRDCGPAGVDVCLLGLAGYLATAGPTLSTASWSHYLETTGTLLEGWFPPSGAPRITDLPALISGRDLMRRLGLQPGPEIGDLLEEIREAQVTGEVTSADAALALARRLLADKKPCQ